MYNVRQAINPQKTDCYFICVLEKVENHMKEK
jgi:hypothetical protein